MPLFSDTTIERMANEGENNFAVSYPCILTRIALNVTLGNPIIQLPDDVKSVKRVTWKGFKLDPLPQRNFREIFENATQQGRPFWYVFNNVGQNQLQLFPTPSESLESTTIGLYGPEIANRCIITYWQVPDFASATIPPYFRRRLLKAYVLRGCFSLQGQGQNLKNVEYFKNKWRMLKERYGNLLTDLHNKPRKLVVQGITASYYFPGAPVLPIDRFGLSVDKGE